MGFTGSILLLTAVIIICALVVTAVGMQEPIASVTYLAQLDADKKRLLPEHLLDGTQYQLTFGQSTYVIELDTQEILYETWPDNNSVWEHSLSLPQCLVNHPLVAEGLYGCTAVMCSVDINSRRYFIGAEQGEFCTGRPYYISIRRDWGVPDYCDNPPSYKLTGLVSDISSLHPDRTVTWFILAKHGSLVYEGMLTITSYL